MAGGGTILRGQSAEPFGSTQFAQDMRHCAEAESIEFVHRVSFYLHCSKLNGAGDGTACGRVMHKGPHEIRRKEMTRMLPFHKAKCDCAAKRTADIWYHFVQKIVARVK